MEKQVCANKTQLLQLSIFYTNSEIPLAAHVPNSSSLASTQTTFNESRRPSVAGRVAQIQIQMS